MIGTERRIGDLRQRITLDGEPVTRTPDGDGGYTTTLTPLNPSVVWASVAPATPSDIARRVGNTVEAKISHLVTIRYHSGVTTKTRITFGSRLLYVRGIQNPEELNVALELACEEILS